jgi:hypothetical protein
MFSLTKDSEQRFRAVADLMGVRKSGMTVEVDFGE